MKCQNCNRILEEPMNFCIYCGNDLEKNPPKEITEDKMKLEENLGKQIETDEKYLLQCPNCNQILEKPIKFCVYCGNDFEKHLPKKITEDKSNEKKEQGNFDQQSFNPEDVKSYKKSQKKENRESKLNKNELAKKRRKWPFLLFILIVIALGIFGYIKKQETEYNAVVNEGIELVRDYSYGEAVNQFKEAMDFTNDDGLAEQLYDATTYLKDAQKLYDADDLDAALTKVEQILEINQSVVEEDIEYFELLNERTQKLKTKITDLIDKHAKLSEQLKDLKDLIDLEAVLSEKELDNAIERTADILNTEEITHPYFSQLKEEVDSFQITLNNHKDEIVKARLEQEKKEEQIRKDNQSNESTDMKSEEELRAEAINLIEKEFGYIEGDPYIYWVSLVEDNLVEVEVRAPGPGFNMDDLDEGDLFAAGLVDRFQYSASTKELWIYDALDPGYYLYE